MKMKLFALMIAVAMTAGSMAACSSSQTSQQSKTAAEDTNKPAATEPAKGSTQEAAKYKDGTYKVEFDNFDSHGWKAQLEIGIKDSKIVNVKYDYVNKEGKLKTQDQAYNDSMKAKTGTNPVIYTKTLQDQLIEKQDISKVDAVSGATESTKNFHEMAKVILEQMAPKGEPTSKVLPLPKE
ncbi:MAG: FMN-binding protein [Clostridiales bacterium]|jgi:major membrane immunogen (membrane-anchored lipoprotein)|nr:FMN-binding protein [Eubacteriales bacterium]MDH7566924.1 FMN-binding protein [Clostridiales bacterium]